MKLMLTVAVLGCLVSARVPAAAPPTRAVRLTGARLSDTRLDVAQSLELRRARERRDAGTAITIFSLGTASIFGGIGLAMLAASRDGHDPGARLFGLLAGVSVVPSLVGIPLWASGQRAMNRLRRAELVPGVSIAAFPGAAAVTARWAF